jgi:hypothetical protein
MFTANTLAAPGPNRVFVAMLLPCVKSRRITRRDLRDDGDPVNLTTP